MLITKKTKSAFTTRGAKKTTQFGVRATRNSFDYLLPVRFLPPSALYVNEADSESSRVRGEPQKRGQCFTDRTMNQFIKKIFVRLNDGENNDYLQP